MAGQPLAWMEASNLPEEAYSLAGLIEDYKSVSAEFHSGTILPVGEEPSGRSFTGFQSVFDADYGYLLVYREDTDRGSEVIETWLPEGTQAVFSPVLGYGKVFSAVAGKDGAIEVSLPERNTFALYRYVINR